MTDVIDIKTRKAIKPDIPENATIAQWFNSWKKFCKDYNCQTIAIIGVDKDGIHFSNVIGVNKTDLLTISHNLHDIREAIDYTLYPEKYEELELVDE